MARTKVSDADLRDYLSAGHSQADAARHFGVSEPAIHQRLKRMRALTSQVVALEKAGQVVEEKLTATARLEQVIDEELGWAVQHPTRWCRPAAPISPSRHPFSIGRQWTTKQSATATLTVSQAWRSDAGE